MLTGNSIALLLRASGTDHGDWWSLNGIEYFVLAAVLSLLTSTSSGQPAVTSSARPASGWC